MEKGPLKLLKEVTWGNGALQFRGSIHLKTKPQIQLPGTKLSPQYQNEELNLWLSIILLIGNIFARTFLGSGDKFFRVFSMSFLK